MTSVKTMQCLLLCPSACKHLHPRLDCSENFYENKTEQVETNNMDKPDSQIQQFVPPVLENRLQLQFGGTFLQVPCMRIEHTMWHAA